MIERERDSLERGKKRRKMKMMGMRKKIYKRETEKDGRERGAEVEGKREWEDKD